MKCFSKYLLTMVTLCSISFCQTLNPTELESAKLGKLKAQRQALQASVEMMNAQMQMLQVRIQVSQQLQQQKLSELLSTADQIKKDHKWLKAEYNYEQGDDGVFVDKK